MTSKLLPFAAAAAAIIGVFAVLAVAGAFDDDDGDGTTTLADGESEDNAGGDALGICIAEDDPNYDPDQPCNDMIDEGANGDAEDLPADDPGSLNICIAGATDCADTPVSSTDDIDTIGGGEDGRNLALEASYAALAEMGGPGDAKLAEARPIEWGNACLGVIQADVACAEVITPDWIIILEGGNAIYEFHTDLNGNAVYAPQ